MERLSRASYHEEAIVFLRQGWRAELWMSPLPGQLQFRNMEVAPSRVRVSMGLDYTSEQGGFGGALGEDDRGEPQPSGEPREWRWS